MSVQFGKFFLRMHFTACYSEMMYMDVIRQRVSNLCS